EFNLLLVPTLHSDVTVESLHGDTRRAADRKCFRFALDETQGVRININPARARRFTRHALRLQAHSCGFSLRSPLCFLRGACSCGLRDLTLNLSMDLRALRFDLCLALLCPLRFSLRALSLL